MDKKKSREQFINRFPYSREIRGRTTILGGLGGVASKTSKVEKSNTKLAEGGNDAS